MSEREIDKLQDAFIEDFANNYPDMDQDSAIRLAWSKVVSPKLRKVKPLKEPTDG